jgi:hypothetical protein
LFGSTRLNISSVEEGKISFAMKTKIIDDKPLMIIGIFTKFPSIFGLVVNYSFFKINKTSLSFLRGTGK